MRVVGNDAKPRVGRILLHDAPQRHLRHRGHGVRFVQHDQLERPQRGRGSPGRGGRAEDLLRAGEGLDLFAHHVDAAVVAGVQFQHHLSNIPVSVDAAGEGEDCGGFACAGGAIEEEVGEAVGVNEFVDGGEDVLVAGDVVEGVWSVFFYPSGSQRDLVCLGGGVEYHGKLSSASMGRFAALRLPFALVFSELNVMSSLAGGGSTSISSS